MLGLGRTADRTGGTNGSRRVSIAGRVQQGDLIEHATRSWSLPLHGHRGALVTGNFAIRCDRDPRFPGLAARERDQLSSRILLA